MGADNQAERVIERMEREELLLRAAGRLIRELECSSSLSENAVEAMLDLKHMITLQPVMSRIDVQRRAWCEGRDAALSCIYESGAAKQFCDLIGDLKSPYE